MDRLGTTTAGNRGSRYNNISADFIKNSLIPLDFYRHELPGASFKKHGWNDGGLCAFHADNKPGSFRVNLATGAFTCFACGTKGGDIIAFTMAKHNLNFPDALAKLVDDWGLV